MFTNREEGLARVAALLHRAGFYLFDVHHVRPTPFDLIARRDSTLLLVKVLKNADGLGPEDASVLRLVAGAMGAIAIVVGGTSGPYELEPGILYSRHGVVIVSLSTLTEYLTKGIPPILLSGPGGKFARIDGRQLRRAREEQGLSLAAVAEAAGVSRRTIQLYEEGAGADLAILDRLERFLAVQLAIPLDPFAEGIVGSYRSPTEEESPVRPRPQGPLPPSVAEELNERGWDLIITLRTPFDLLAREERRHEERVLIGVGDLQSAERRSRLLFHVARVAEGESLFVVPERRSRTNVEGVPLVSYQELRRHAGPEELRELLRERRKRP
ncbi:MAG: helix-turn-helix domain-containing protein [Euryarchaeota archaeon]|nr:helix-turn-helix domain-containing protein [Euryarchaeota archaeon]MDE1837571.1 helix-turn-helix domain-containing protein [Euryarchaeota archaeon]MDE1881310.1 helix-turn-helix domain-containing protein [Euryarchaeota archaeon]MDE2045882.1 helix-turn-helix domain-containing protein [Thermoplasmata archaeon]